MLQTCPIAGSSETQRLRLGADRTHQNRVAVIIRPLVQQREYELKKRRPGRATKGYTDAQPLGICEGLGHATIAITLNTYSHAIPAMQEEALIAGLVFADDAAPGATP